MYKQRYDMYAKELADTKAQSIKFKQEYEPKMSSEEKLEDGSKWRGRGSGLAVS